ALEIREFGQVDTGVRGLEFRDRMYLGISERLDRKRVLCVAAGELRAGIPDVEQIPCPMKRAVERWEAIRVHAAERAGESTRQIVPVPEQVEGAIEIGVAQETPAFVGKEDLAHPFELETRLHRVGHVRPMA